MSRRALYQISWTLALLGILGAAACFAWSIWGIIPASKASSDPFTNAVLRQLLYVNTAFLLSSVCFGAGLLGSLALFIQGLVKEKSLPKVSP